MGRNETLESVIFFKAARGVGRPPHEAVALVMQAGQASDTLDGRVPGAMATAPTSSSSLPSVSDPGARGPFAIQVQENLEGLRTHILIAPKELGRDGITHPTLVWISGAGASSSSYCAMLDNVAAHGFFLLDDKQRNFEVPQEVSAQRAAIDWAIAEAQREGGPFYGKLDTSRIAIAGHSLGQVSTFGNVGDRRIKTSIHIAGGLLGNPQRRGRWTLRRWLARMRAIAYRRFSRASGSARSGAKLMREGEP